MTVILETQDGNDFSKTLHIVDKSSHNILDNINLVKNDVSYEYDFISNLPSVLRFNNSLNDLAMILSKISFFNHEFHCVMSVQRMSEFILSDENYTSEYFKFLLESVNQFIDMIKFKIKNQVDADCEDYTELKINFLRYEKFFFTKIYNTKRSHDKKFFEDMLNLLSGGS